MNKQEAIKVLAMENDLMQFNPNTGEDRPIEFQSKDNQDLYQANLLAITALEHQLPKKPTGTGIPYCPHCNKVFVTSNDDYCHRCGGRIDWSDEK